jgi:class 3 adenylate cyclase/tetratricopeptide (TPR) repeat protein
MASAAAAMRKTVTVLFCDLADSTELGERLDPERYRELLTRWYEAVREPIERHGGTIEKFIGDAVMAVFGVPLAREDDALRAVRAAVEIRASVARLNEALAGPRHPNLEVRIGVNTGEVATGTAETTLVSGDAVNTAKRLEQAAPDGDIFVGPATRRLVENAVELEPVEPIEAKGKRTRVEAWRVLGTIDGVSGFARRLDAPLVGRRRELAALRNEVAAVEQERGCRLFTVFGSAGVGKSRLAAELLAGTPAVLTMRCVPYGDGASLLPLGDLVRSVGGEDAVHETLAAEHDGDLIAQRICTGTGSSEELQWAVRRLLETLARDAPLVVFVEDVHWAQPAFLDLLEYLAGWLRGAPVLLLCLARAELLDARPRWPGAGLTLGPLTDAESQELLDELATEWPLTPSARQQVADAAEGNPLFLEQMVAMLAEGGPAREVPPTIQALLAARLDSLEPDERSVLERAAVLGRDFSRAAVTALSEGEPPATLLALVRKELIRPAPSALEGDDGFRFRHTLIRDAAYAAIPKRMRAELHERAGTWLGEHDADDEVVGYHLEQANQYLFELGEHDDAIAARGGELLGAAGMRASARGDAAAAQTLLSRSLALLPPKHGLRIELLRELSTALWLANDLDAAEHALSDSIRAAHAAGDERLEWYGRLEHAARTAAAHGETDALVVTAERAIEVFERLGDDRGLARAWRRIALAAYKRRSFAEAAAAAERAYRHARATDDEQERARTADMLCSALLYGPVRAAEAIERVQSVLDSAGSNIVMRANAATSLAALLAMRGEFDDARRLFQEAGSVFDELGLTLPKAGWLTVAAWGEALAGDPAAAAAMFRDAYAIVDAGGHESPRVQIAADLAFLLAVAREPAQARSFARVCESAKTIDPESLARLRATQALLDRERGSAERLAREAVAIAEESDNLNLQGAMRLTLARVRRDGDELAHAVQLFEQKGNVAAASSAGLWSLQR